jgi:hypothetical protein
VIERIAQSTAAAVAAAVLVCPLKAQTVADRIGEIRNGTVHMSFAAREGVCVRGDRTRIVSRTKRSDERWNGCDAGSVRVALYLVDGTVVDLETHVGGRWRGGGGGVDLGTVPAPEAADYLITLAAVVDSDPGKEAVFAASLADSATVWPGLERLARDRSRPEEIRRQAIFWLGQVEESTPALIELYDRLERAELRERVIFAYAQKRNDAAALDELIGIARSEPDWELRGKAIFWLGQVRDPRAVQFLAELINR